MNSNYRKIIMILIILLIVLIVMIGIVLILINKQENVDSYSKIENIPTDSYGDAQYAEDIEKTVVKLKNENSFYYLESLMQNFYLYLKMSNAKVVYNILDTDYKKNYDLTENNILEKLKVILNNKSKFNMQEVYVRDSLYKPIYYCYGIEKIDNKDIYFRVNQDINNSAYSISILNKEDYGKYTSGKLEEKNDKVIIQNQFNKIKSFNLSEEEIVKKYFEDFIYKEATDSNMAYSLLNEEYKNKRFKTISEFQEYLKLNKEKIETLNTKGIKLFEEFNNEEDYKKYLDSLVHKGIASYKIKNKNDQKQITCIDDYGNYYTFIVSSVMEYNVILDNHTIDLDYFIEEYNDSSDTNKIIMNIDRIKDAINTYDYQYIYGKMDKTFKNNNFSSSDKLKTFFNANFFDLNEFKIISMDKQQDIYSSEIQVTDRSRKSNKTVKLNMIMKLEEGTNFTMSFSID